MALIRTEFYRSELLSARYVACRSAGKAPGDFEYSDANTLILPLRGAFVEHFSSRNQVLAEPSVALIFPAGRASRVSHPVSSEDDCLAMDFSDPLFHEVWESAFPASQIIGTHSLLFARAMATRNLLWHRLAKKLAGPLEVEEIGTALLSHAFKAINPDRESRRTSKIAWQIDAVKVLLLTHPGENWNLTALSRHAECSPFHLTRIFRKKVGLPLHQYHLHARLSRGIDALLDTQKDLTTIALDLGFSSHSHFTAAFRQKIGFSPSQFRKLATHRQIAETRKILIAQLS
jgi:AraC family transcriptional regulator